MTGLFRRMLGRPPAPPPAGPPDGTDPAVAALTEHLRLDLDPATANPTAAWPGSEEANPPAPPPPAGPAAAGYRLLDHLGSGTFGTVFLAEELASSQKVAIKFFAHGTARELDEVRREVGLLAGLGDVPDVVKLYRTELDADPPYFVMQFAPGGSLADWLRARGAVPAGAAVRLVRRVADALAAAHAKGVIHCDLKPANILLDAARNPLVADLGQAHLSHEQRPALGTFLYMPPEQADASRPAPDTRWDVHALGAILYECLTGQPPRRDALVAADPGGPGPLADKLRRYREAVLAAPPPAAHRRAAGVDRSLARIVDRCLHPDPTGRYPNAAGVAAALRERDRRRAARPLVAAAVAATVLVPAAVTAHNWATAAATADTAEAAGVQLLRDDRIANSVAAGRAAELLQQAIGARLYWLEERAGDAGLRQALADADAAPGPATWEADAPHRARVRALYEQEGAAGLFPDGLGLAVAAGGRGRLLAEVGPAAGGGLGHWGDDPAERAVLAGDWAYRDWFAGGGDQPAGTRRGPVRRPHVSPPFRSRRDGRAVVGFSVPVFPPAAADAAPVDPVGVVIGVLPVEDVRGLVSTAPAAAANTPEADRRRVWVGNSRGQYLSHPNLPDDPTGAAVLGAGRADPPAVLAALWERVRPQAGDGQPLDLTTDADARAVWRDPLGAAGRQPEVPTAAAVARIPEADDGEWLVVVQPAGAGEFLHAMADVRRRVVVGQVLTLGVFAGLAAGFWAWLVRFLRRADG